MPPRFVYWTILIDEGPTAFRARQREELLPTLVQLRRTNQNVVMKWFARGRLWDTPEQERWARTQMSGSKERRDRGWRPGGDHRDPRERFQKRTQAGSHPGGRAEGKPAVPKDATRLGAKGRTDRRGPDRRGPSATGAGTRSGEWRGPAPHGFRKPERRASGSGGSTNRPGAKDARPGEVPHRTRRDWRSHGNTQGHRTRKDRNQRPPGAATATGRQEAASKPEPAPEANPPPKQTGIKRDPPDRA
jgi:hypothetical protein